MVIIADIDSDFSGTPSEIRGTIKWQATLG